MTDGPTTARAQRREAAATGAESDAVDRRSARSDPGGSSPETTSRQRQQRAAREIADDIEIERDGVGTVQRMDGLDVFLRSPGEAEFARGIRRDFASEADFVDRDDVDAGVDPQAITAEPRIPRDRRDRVAGRARRETARDAEFIEDDDLRAEVSRFGVESIGVAEERRPDVADRTARELAAEDPFAEPDDFDVDVSAAGIESAGLTDTGQRRRAGRQFEQETPLSAVDPTDDVVRDGDAFALAGGAQRRVAAREFERDIDLFDDGTLDPESDIRATDSGFGLGEDRAAEVAAADIDRQIDEFDVGADDVELEETDDGGFEAVFEREVER